jgi:hypothetical protein
MRRRGRRLHVRDLDAQTRPPLSSNQTVTHGSTPVDQAQRALQPPTPGKACYGVARSEGTLKGQSDAIYTCAFADIVATLQLERDKWVKATQTEIQRQAVAHPERTKKARAHGLVPEGISPR